jgi:DNA repair protein RadD
MQLRDYQQRTLDDLYQWWMQRPNENPLVTVPTGGGKSVIIAELCRLLFDTWPEEHPRTVVLVPSKELAEQNAAKLKAMLPTTLKVGYYSAALGKKEPDADVIVATIGSIANAAHLLGNIKCVVIDECFTAETLIATTEGNKRIADIRVGDAVYHAAGIGVVQAISEREVNSICTVRLSNGTEIRTTDNHPFFTNAGWKCAKDLARGDGLVRLQDMPALWRDFSSLEQDQGKRNRICASDTAVQQSQVLLDLLFQESGERHVGEWSQREDGSNAAGDWAQAVSKWWKRPWNDRPSSGCSFDAFNWLDSRVSNQDGRSKECANIPNLLQGGHWESEQENCHRTGRELTQRETKTAGSEEGCVPAHTWVESVTHQELSGSEPVFNLQVGGHPSYFADGVLVHNCHLVNPDGREAGRYRKFLSDLGKYCQFRVVGWTATPFRGNGIWLTEGDEPLFHGVASRVTVQELLSEGHLAPLIRPVDAINTRIDTAGIGTSSGDFNLDELSDRVENYLELAAEEACKLAADRKKWIAFTPTVLNANHLSDLLNARGIVSAVVCGDTPKADRERLIAEFRTGRIRCLVTVLALATGFDVPDVDCIIWLRPTQSPVLYVQGAGRGLRPAHGKDNCLWLDFSDTTERMGPVDTIKGRNRPRKKDKEQGAPKRTCPECGEQCAAALTMCPTCGFEFPLPEKEARTASNAAVMSSQIQTRINTYELTAVKYGLHQKEGKPDSVRVDYWSGLRCVASEWLCFEHGGFATGKAINWFNQRKPAEWGMYEEPEEAYGRVSAFLLQYMDHMRKPSHIVINEQGKFPEIVSFKWEENQSEPARTQSHQASPADAVASL